MKALRFLWLVVSGIMLLPLIILGTLWWLIVLIRAACQLNEPWTNGFVYCYQYLRKGILMNVDFVKNGF